MKRISGGLHRKVFLLLVALVALWLLWAQDLVQRQPVTDPGGLTAPSLPRSLPIIERQLDDHAAVVERYPISSARFANGAANRAPHRAVTPLFGSSLSDVAEGKARFYVPPLTSARPLRDLSPESNARCWNRAGDPSAVPKWVIALFAAVGAVERFEHLANESDTDRWGILLAWVPSRFMPPQKAGRNAAGQVITPPTRGREPNFYLREYNATWHATGRVGDLEYHFQTVHRNALAVCVRERLHVTALRCTPHHLNVRHAALLHHCLCRHCTEAVHRGAPGAGSPRIPGYSEHFARRALYSMPLGMVQAVPFLQQSPRVVPRQPSPRSVSLPLTPSQRPDCVDATAAPWLASPSLWSWPYENLHNNLSKLLQVQADPDRVVMVSIFNRYWLDHLHNFYFSLVRDASLTNLVVATMDDASLALCRRQRLPCFNATRYAEYEPEVDGASHKVGAKRKVTEALSWIKPRLAVAVLEEGYGFFMVDLDMTWNARPMGDVLSHGTDLTHQCDADARTSINSGFYFARPTPQSWLYFNNMMVFRPEENSDQTAMKLFVRYDHTHGLSNVCLDKWAFNMKCNYKRPGSVVRKGGTETFEWIPFDRNRTRFTWKILHATCLNGALQKMRYLRTMNAWYLDELDQLTNNRTYCLRFSDGSVLEGMTAVTEHSPSYTHDVDESFLQARH